MSIPRKLVSKTYPDLRYEVTIKRGLPIQILCEWAHISRATLSLRLNNSSPWTTSEMYSILDELNLPDSDLVRLFPRNGGLPQ